MTNFEERAPLEMGTGSKKQKALVCPGCKCLTTVRISCIGAICGSCHKYFSADDSLPEDQAESTSDQVVPVNMGFVKLKGEMEEKAYKWKDEQLKKRKEGVTRNFEPREKGKQSPVKKWGKDKDF